MKWRRLLSSAFLLSVINALGGEPWHHPLYLANGGYWPKRVTVTIENPGDAAVAGEPVFVKVPMLAGAGVESVRVCNASGQELLFDARDAGGHLKRRGELAVDDQIVVPAECDAKSKATIYIYASNDEALAVPDFLKAGFMNADFESGREAPDGWKTAETDAKHVATHEKNGGRNDSRCVKVEVAAGAEPTWVKWQQAQIPVTPGRSYRVSGWVKAENVVGRAGWFLHVNGERPMLLAPMLDAGSGTFDWKRVEHTFTVPPTGTNATFGTVLRGTGRAWFDDAEFVALERGPALRATAGPLEELKLHATATGKPQFSREWPVRATVRVLNLTDQPVNDVLVSADLRVARARLRGLPANAAVQVVDPATGQVAATCARLADSVLFSASVPARSGREFHLYFSATRSESATDTLAAYERLVNGPQNLAPNPSFERGTKRPEGWQAPRDAAGKFTARLSDDARLGKHSAEFTVPKGAPQSWIGWRSGAIPIQPGATYLLSAWLKSQGVDGEARLHAHLLGKDGKVAAGGHLSTTPGVSGDADWTRSATTVRAAGDAASIELHLTMNDHGTLRHDGVLLC
ncbi:MAG: hypothetical protein FJ388_12610, partial [Verrucomicrobia bacterium]|nr:hypothetical protein [Verrucomicrobiota bacterium]